MYKISRSNHVDASVEGQNQHGGSVDDYSNGGRRRLTAVAHSRTAEFRVLSTVDWVVSWYSICCPLNTQLFPYYCTVLYVLYE